jgi:hypothetical protein
MSRTILLALHVFRVWTGKTSTHLVAASENVQAFTATDDAAFATVE